MPVLEIMQGVKVYYGEDYSILFGCPPEIVKALMASGMEMPGYIVLPDIPYKNGIVQNSTEFPLYYYYFMQKNKKKGKMAIVGETRAVDDNRELLRLCLLGPTMNEYMAIGDSKYYQDLFKESREISLKDDSGNEFSIDGMVDFYRFNSNEINTSHFTLYHKDINVYEINGRTIDINFEGVQDPPFDYRPNLMPQMPCKFGVDVLGGGSGFTPKLPCSGLLLNYNSEYMLLDCIPYIDHALKARGVSKQQVRSVFISHIHDDHCSMLPLLLFDNKIKLLGTKEIYWMVLKKLSLQTGIETGELYSFFDFVELFPYKENEFYGMTIIPHYTVHSIPTIGATFKMKDAEAENSIVFVADNKALPEIKKMAEKGVVPSWKHEHLENLYREKHTLFFPDGGMGILHGDPGDSIESKSGRVVFLHLEKLPDRFDATFSTAKSGKRYILSEHVENSYYAYIVQVLQVLYNNFPGISYDWITALMNNIKIIQHNTDDVILKQNEPVRDSLFIILSGNCQVKKHDGEKFIELAVKEAGDFIGELSLLKMNEKRSASVIAVTPVTLCEISIGTFYSFLEEENRLSFVRNMWQIRSMIEKFPPFSDFSDSLNERVAKVSRFIEYREGSVIIKQGDPSEHLYIVLEGRLSVSRDGEVFDELLPGELFGEFGVIMERPRNATVKTLEKAKLIQIHKSDINDIIFNTPALNLYVLQVLHRRMKF